jgi:hypothetical protein
MMYSIVLRSSHKEEFGGSKTGMLDNVKRGQSKTARLVKITSTVLDASGLLGIF